MLALLSYHIRYFTVASTVLQSFQIDFPEHILSGNERNMGSFTNGDYIKAAMLVNKSKA